MVKDVHDSHCTVFERFIIENLRDLGKIVLTWSIFEIEKCSFFLNGSEFCQKLICSIIRVLVRHPHAYSGIKLWQRPLRGEVSHQSPVCPPLKVRFVKKPIRNRLKIDQIANKPRDEPQSRSSQTSLAAWQPFYISKIVALQALSECQPPLGWYTLILSIVYYKRK